MTDRTPEITEAEAAGAVAALYGDIKTAMGVGMVNLIYRHMATMENALPWAWAALRPVFASGDVARAAEAMVAELDLPALPPVPRRALRVVGVDEKSEGAIRRVIGDYNRGNSLNIFAMAALRHWIRAGAPEGGAPEADGETPEPPADLPPIVPLDGMAPELGNLVVELSAPIAPPDRPMIPGLYRHLARWPGFLALTAAPLLEAVAGGVVGSRAAAARARAEAAAPDLAALLSASGAPPPSPEHRDSLADTLGAYVPGPIARMVVLGQLLARALPEQ